MIQRMQTFALTRPVISVNAWQEDIPDYKHAGTVRVALSVADGRTLEQNQALRVKSTHRGLTHDDVRVGDRFGGYVVDYVIAGTRYTQLLLSREEAVL